MFRVRVTEAELAAWKAAAEREGVTVSAWLRSRVRVPPVGILEKLPVVRAKKGTPVAAGPSVPPEPELEPELEPGPERCRRCGHARASHWIKGCLAGCACSEGRYRE